MKIYVLPRKQFDEVLNEHNINDESVEYKSWSDSFFISILSSVAVPDGNFHLPAFNENHPNVLTLTFDDVTHENKATFLHGDGNVTIGKGIAISEKQADEMVDFIIKNLDKKEVLIHCAAGISRSGAVGSFINEITKGTYDEFKRINPRVYENLKVLNLLRKKYNEKL